MRVILYRYNIKKNFRSPPGGNKKGGVIPGKKLPFSTRVVLPACHICKVKIKRESLVSHSVSQR